MTLKEAYDYGVYFLSANGVDEAEFKSLCLVCHLDGIKNSQFEFYKSDEIIMKRFADLLWRVKSGEPLQYVIGKWDFYESEFYVGKGVLIPRPETEELTDLAVKFAKKIKNPVVIDLCAGSGCIGISIAKAVKNSKVYLVEKSEDAFVYLKKNADSVNNTILINEDLYNLPQIEKVDIIVSNPPYIKSNEISSLQSEVLEEPIMALDGGVDGLEFYRFISQNYKQYLKNGGRLLFEIGNEQGEDVRSILMSNGYKDIEIKKDIYGNRRMAVARI